MSEEELIRGCLKHERAVQRTLYELFFGRMMNVCLRYAKNQQEAKEILLDGFKNAFARFHGFVEAHAKRRKDLPSLSLEEWMEKQMIASAIRLLHRNRKEYFVSSTVSVRDLRPRVPEMEETSDEQILKFAGKDKIIRAIHELTPSYRAVYNMHEIDGYSHQEISRHLDISEATSKDTLEKAKFNIRKNLLRLLNAGKQKQQ